MSLPVWGILPKTPGDCQENLFGGFTNGIYRGDTVVFCENCVAGNERIGAIGNDYRRGLRVYAAIDLYANIRANNVPNADNFFGCIGDFASASVV